MLSIIVFVNTAALLELIKMQALSVRKINPYLLLLSVCLPDIRVHTLVIADLNGRLSSKTDEIQPVYIYSTRKCNQTKPNITSDGQGYLI
jgi:hypothetical protein